ncbi:alpha/beta hydrolase [Nocardioides cynanchi]|uniref:alpha/beta hydrolase n=1 Tax=Nocardioides cynanchi TaxID=2558918 RepID=UPI0012466E18|nr:alpha/beta hydrolase [Nocardioides cynanchi]
MTAPAGSPDVLGAPYTLETIALPDDDEGAVVASLVHRPADVPSSRAVLHVHGFADYFFQTAYAEWWTARGYDFYALDLRKYGRSLLPHQTPNFTTDLHDYFPELDEAWERVHGDHPDVVLSGHSTGGLTVSLWAADRRTPAAGAVLNAPWLDLQGSAVLRHVVTPLVTGLARRTPKRPIPRTVTGFYARSLHRDHDGEWDFDLAWKPIESWPAYAGWLAAVRRGHAELHRGLDLPFPVLVLSSAASASPAEMGEDVHVHDIVLDVEQIRRWSPALGRHVTYVGIPHARHDVFLSREAPRTEAFAELDGWLTAYVT